ncbi:MAG TPA: GatB/YqeY domain-containing protein [Rhizomicrobium sp.]|nr:GatB/YqeY domain-containing protein [Rhizomicrobium sp.]
MTLRDSLNENLKDAMKARDQKRVSTLRMVLAALKERDIANRTEESRAGIAEEDIYTLLAKMIRQREESASLYESGGRPELAAAELEEIAIIREFLPRQMNEEEMRAAAHSMIAETGAASLKDMGKVMTALKQQYAGRMDFGRVGGIVKDVLAQR